MCARKFVDFNPRTNIAFVYHMGTHTCTPQLETRRKKKCMAKILQNVDPQTNMSGKEMAVNQVEKMLETGTMEDVHNEAGLWINYRRNKQVMNDAIPSVPKDENSFDAVAIKKRKTDEYDPYYICHALNVISVQQQLHAHFSVTPNTMHTGTNRKAQQSCGSGTNRE